MVGAMSRTAVDPTSLPWLRLGEAGAVVRVAYVALAALGHVGFLWPLVGDQPADLLGATCLAGCNALVLAWVAFRRGRRAVDAAALVGRVVGVTMALGLGFMLGTFAWNQGFTVESIFLAVVIALVLGSVGGLLGSIVAVPLGLAVDRWRAQPVPRRGLDAWARLAVTGSVAFLMVAPAGPHPTGGSGWCAVGLAARVGLPVAWLLLSGWLWGVERGARRDLATLPDSPCAPYRWVTEESPDPAVAPAWSLTGKTCERALVRDAPGAAYREGGEQVVAWWPGEEHPSWRDGALRLAVGLGALGLVVRALT